MDTAVEIVDVHTSPTNSGASWAAIAAGAVAAAALTLVLVAFAPDWAFIDIAVER